MKVRIKYEGQGLTVDETFTAPHCEAVVAAMKIRVASEAGFAARLIISGMSPLGFAQEVVWRYNRQTGRGLPLPASCEDFIRTAESEGIASVLEP